MSELKYGGVSLRRVSYLDVPVPAELLGLDEATVQGLDWASPAWAEAGQVRIGAAAWFSESGGQRFVLDPVQAVDVVLRADAEAEAANEKAIGELFEGQGFARDSIDVVLMTHIEGVGMVASRSADGWVPYFPNARILVSQDQYDAFCAAEDPGPDHHEYRAWRALIDAGVVETYVDGEEVIPGVVAEVTGCHGPGHSVFHIGSDDQTVIFIGHLAVSPVHLATGPCAALNAEPEAAWRCATEIANRGRDLIGPLWPEPGAGRWVGDAVEPLAP